MPESLPDLFYYSGDDAIMASAALTEAGAVECYTARDRFGGVEPGISVRESMNQPSLDYFRPGEANTNDHADVIAIADKAYHRNGIVKFVFDMMTDFVNQGIQIYHPAASKQKRYRAWAKRIGFQHVSDRFVNLAFRHAAAIVKKDYAQLNQGDLDNLEQAFGAGDVPDTEYERVPRTRKNRIPLRYTFLNPGTVEPIGGDLAAFVGETKYGLKIPANILKAIKNPRSPEERELVAKLPPYIRQAAETGRKLIPLDPEKVAVFHYKKDDWKQWGEPIIMSVINDIVLYDAMKRADRSALDGSISKIRLWTLGDPEHKIMPGPGAFKKLREQLLAAAGGSSMDLIWDSTLKLTETSSDIATFLGMAKYEPVLRAIYAGLGIPQSLTGGSDGGMANNALSLKTLIERLQYARNLLVSFWEAELREIQRAFGDRQPAIVKFANMSLSDEATEKMLWLHLWDRNLIDDETVRERFGELHEVVTRRVQKDVKAREDGSVPPKVGPFIDAAGHPDQMAKAALAQGTLSPTEAGVIKKPRKKGDKSLLDITTDLQQQTVDMQKEKNERDMNLAEKQQKINEKQNADMHSQKLQQNEDIHQQSLQQKDAEHKVMLPVKKKAMQQQIKTGNQNKGTPGQGRPKGQKDQVKRKQRTPKVGASASLIVMQAIARENLYQIAEVANARFLATANKKTLRSLTTDEAEALEQFKFNILCATSPDERADAQAITTLIDNPPAPNPEHAQVLAGLLVDVYGQRGMTPTTDDVRELQIAAYAVIHSEGDSDGEVDS
jgi:hypothetical protein